MTQPIERLNEAFRREQGWFLKRFSGVGYRWREPAGKYTQEKLPSPLDDLDEFEQWFKVKWFEALGWEPNYAENDPTLIVNWNTSKIQDRVYLEEPPDIFHNQEAFVDWVVKPMKAKGFKLQLDEYALWYMPESSEAFTHKIINHHYFLFAAIAASEVIL